MLTDRLLLLARRLSGLAARRPGFALTLQGEAGIGKSYRARALLQRCSSAGFSTPATRPLPSVLLALPRPKKCPAPLEGTLERLKRGETLEPGLVLEALGTLLGALSPFVLYLEDLHEAAPEQLEALTRLAGRVSHLKGVALLASSRTPPPEAFETLALERLSPVQSRELLEAEVFAPLPPDALEWIYSKAAGNPLYTLEFFRSLSRAGNAWSDGRHWHWRAPLEDWVPVSIEALIERILLEAASTPDVQAALETLALLPDADELLHRAVSQLEPSHFEAALQHLRARGVLQASGFAHPLYREMALKNLSLGSRKTLSRRTLEALIETDLEAAAEFVEGANLDREQALELLKLAASSAKARGDLPRAGQFLATGTAFATGTERGELALEAAGVLRSSDVVRALELAEIASQLLPESTEAVLLQATLLAHSGRQADTDALFSRLPEDYRNSVEGLGQWLTLLVASGRIPEVLELWTQHPELHTLQNTEVVTPVIYAFSSLGQQDQAESLTLGALTWPDLPLLGRSKLLAAQAGVLMRRGRNDEADLCFTEALEIALEHAFTSVIPFISANRGILRLFGEHPETAFDDLERASKLFAEMGNTRWYAHLQVNLAQLELTCKHFEQAEQRLMASLTVLEGMEVNDSLFDCLDTLCRLYEQWDTSQSLVMFEKYIRYCVRVNDTLQSPRLKVSYLQWQGMAEIKNQRHEGALTYFEQALLESVAMENDQTVAACHFSRADVFRLLGRSEDAVLEFGVAREIAEAIPYRELVLKIDLELSRLHGDAATLQRLYHEAQTSNNVNVLEHIRRYFPELASSEASAPVQTQTLRLEVLGPLQLEGQLVRGGKRQELLKVLLEARISGKSELSSSELLESLYPGEDEEHALSALKGTVFKVRSSYGAGLIVTTPGGYALGSVSSDAEDFLKNGNTRLWRGVYSSLEGSGAALQTLSLALESAAKSELENDPQEAARAARILCEMDPYSLEGLKLLCESLKACGNYKSLAREYQKGRARLLEVGETLPQTWSEFLMTALAAPSS